MTAKSDVRIPMSESAYPCPARYGGYTISAVPFVIVIAAAVTRITAYARRAFTLTLLCIPNTLRRDHARRQDKDATGRDGDAARERRRTRPVPARPSGRPQHRRGRHHRAA